MNGRAASTRSGFTLLELTIAMTVFSIIVVGGLGFMAAQTRLFSASVDRTTALTRLRYALFTAERDVRTLGSNLAPGQPGLVYAGRDVIAFNADYASNVANDVFAVYVDPDAPTGQVTAPRGPIAIPGTAFTYPDTVYEVSAGVNSPAELLILYFVADTSTADPDDYMLFRQVNNGAPERVAAGLLRVDGAPFFRYQVEEAVAGGSVGLDSVPSAALPLTHAVPIHLSAADTGALARIDSVRAVTVRLAARAGAASSTVLRLARTIAMPNAGLGHQQACGSTPLLQTALSAAAVVQGTGEPAVLLQWGQAVDEAGGERDVIRYVLWRRTPPSTEWGDPYLSIPAGSASYSYTDTDVTSGTSYEYALAAQDCSPALSSLTSAGPVVAP